MHSEPIKGIICGILSGDSVVVRLVNYKDPIVVVCLEYLVAPKLGFSNGKSQDEEYGFDSWTYLRDKCLNKHVYLKNELSTTRERTCSGFGKLKVMFARIVFPETNEDVGLSSCAAGFVQLRQNKNQSPVNGYQKKLLEAQEAAKASKVGIWQEGTGFVRPLPVPINAESILSRKYFECNVDGIINATTLSLFILPTHENIHMSFAGLKPVKFNDEGEEELKKKSRIDAINKFLNKKIHVGIFQIYEKQKNYRKEDDSIPTFIGSILDSKLQLAVQDTVMKGYAIYNTKNHDYCPNLDRILKKQLIAQENKSGYWANHEPRTYEPIRNMAGIITSIKGSNALNIMVEGQNHLITLNSIDVPLFSTMMGTEAGGFEAREYLRKKYLTKYVTIEVEGQMEDRIYGTVSMKGVSINEDLVANGLAKFVELKEKSSRESQIKEAEEKAKSAKIGIWSDEFKPFEIKDCTSEIINSDQFNELKDKGVNCIIEHIYSSTCYAVLIPEKHWLIRVSLNGLIPLTQKDEFGKIAKSYCLGNLIQTDAELIAKTYDKLSNTIWVDMNQSDGQSISYKMLDLGFTEIHKKFLKEQDPQIQQLKEAQDSARARSQGIWADHTRHLAPLIPGQMYRVKMTAVWKPTRLSVQDMNEFELIESQLNIPTENIKETPKKNDCLLYKAKDNSLRARVENVDVIAKKAKVRFIDFCVTKDVNFGDLYLLPDALRNIPPAGRTVSLAGVKASKKRIEEGKEDCNRIWEMFSKSILYMQVVEDDGGEPSVVLLDRDDIKTAVHLGFVIVQENMGFYVEEQYPPEFQRIFAQIKELEQQKNAEQQ